MITPLDTLLNRITMYRLVLYALIALLLSGVALSGLGLLPFPPLALALSTVFLVLMCWATNTIFSWVFNVPTNVESSVITGLILALILDPARSIAGAQLLGWAAILAMAAKYLLARHKTHIFNPAAIAVVVTAFVLKEPASWWVGTAGMLPITLLVGVLVVRKVRQEAMVGVFLAAALATVCVISALLRLPLARELQLLLGASPLFFFAAIMLTEPLTAPPTKIWKRVYALLVGVLFVPQIHLGGLYSTPELALVAGNLFSFVVSGRQRVTLKLKKRTKLAPNMVDFVFTPSRRLAFAPGQYMEWTLAHPHADRRGNRRYFTLASSPTEDSVRLGVRFYPKSSSFKRALMALNGRATLFATQVAGDFILPEDPSRKLAFLAGGIGITPYRSMLKYLLDTKQRRDIVLLYANRSPQEIVYRDVLGEAQTRLGLKALYTLTDAASTPADWSGPRGRIDAAMIRATIPDYQERTFYVSGPPDMVRACRGALLSLGLPRARIKEDDFAGLV